MSLLTLRWNELDIIYFSKIIFTTAAVISYWLVSIFWPLMPLFWTLSIGLSMLLTNLQNTKAWKSWKFKLSQHSSVGRASAWSHTVRQQQHSSTWFWAPPIPVHRYMEENGSAAMLATKRSAGVTPEVNFMEYVTCMSVLSTNKAAHSGFETQWRCH